MKLWLVRAVSAALGCIAVSAATFLSEPFPYPDASALTGTAGSPWTTLTGTAGELTTAGGSLTLSPTGTESVRAPIANGPHAATTLWTAFDLRATTLPTATGAVFGQLSDASGTPRAGIIATTDGAASGSYRLRIGASALVPSSASLPLNLAVGQTYQVVVSFVPLTGAATLWINPTHAETTIHTVTATDPLPVASGIDAFQWIQSTDAGSLVVDNLKVASSFAEVTVPCAPQPTGLVGWWTGDGTTANETGGTAATLANGANYTFGRVGQAFALDGSNDCVSIGSLNALDAATGITVGAWIRRDNVSSTVAGIISQWNTSPQLDNRFILYLGESGSARRGSFAVQFSDGTVGSLASLNLIPADTWMHIAATWDAATGALRIYKNGELDRSTTVGAGKVLAGTPGYTAKIGEWGVLRTSVYKFPGDIDEAFVADRAFTAAEIAALANAGGSGWCRSTPIGGGTGDSFVIEAEDFDHNSGQPVALTSTMPYAGGSAAGLSAVNGIDFNRTTTTSDDDLYRIGESPNQPIVLNSAVESDRGPWEANISYRLTRLAGNEWFNFTREIPAGRYRIIAAMSAGGSRPLAARLSVVTAGHGTTSQTSVEIGRFSGTAAQGRSHNRFLPLQNDSGDVLVDLDGTVTLRLSAGAGDIDYLQLVPEAAPKVTVTPELSEAALGGGVTLTANATGEGPFTYQWRHNGVRIPSATGPTLELTSVADTDRGAYSCMVGNAAGYATGDSVLVTVVHPLPYDTTVAANLPNPGAGVLSGGEGVDLYTLTGTAGEWVYFDEHSGNACALQWELIGPSGTSVFHHWLGGGCGNDGDTGLVQLTETGSFQLRVFTTDASDTGYGFRVTQVPEPLTFAITIGDHVTEGAINSAPVAGAGNLEAPADADLYTFSAAAGQRVFFDEQAGDACFTQWSLTAPDGTQLFHHWLGFGCWNDGDPGTIELPVDGTYTLRVWTIDTRFGPYAFRLWPVVPDAFSIALGDIVAPGLIGSSAAAGAGAIGTPGNKDLYTFSGTTGDWVFFDEITGNGCATFWSLTTPGGTTLFTHRLGHTCWDDADAGRIQLPEDGTYTLTVFGSGESIAEYSFALFPTGPDETFDVSLPLDIVENGINATATPGAGTLQNPGQQDVYSFTLTEPAILYVEDRGAACCIDWRLEDPDGGHVFWDRVDGHDPGRLGLSKLGTYRLRVFPVSSYREWSGPYSLKLHLLPPELPMNLAVDETVSDGFIGENATPGAGRIESAGIHDVYQFTAEAGDVLYLEDLGAAQCCIDWQIRDPNNNYLMCCDRLDGNDVGRYHVSVSGTYTVYVYPAGPDPNYVGTYSFRLRRVVDDEFAIALDDLVSDGAIAGLPRAGAGRLEIPGGYDIYTFHAEAGQLLYLEDLGADACCLDWQIRDPNNGYLMCCDRLDGHDLGRYQVSVTGEHTIYVYQAGALPEWLGGYSFRVRAIPPDPTFRIGYDQVVAANSIGGTTVEGAGTIRHPGAYNLYTFQGTAGDVVYLEDMGAEQCCLDWQIRDPNGGYLMCCDRLDGSDVGRYTLGVTGTYTVYVYPAGASPDYIGDHSFQIRSIPSDGRFAIAIDQVVSVDSIGGVATPGAGRLEYAGAYDYYTFTGTAGQTLYLDDLGADRCCMYWYILRPDGNYLMCCDYLDGYDTGRYDLPLDGTYTVVVYPGGASPDYSGSYSFRLRSAPPFINRQPVDLRLLVGTSAELSVAADSPFGITGYQWFRGSLPVGSSSPSLPLPGVTPLDAGDYSVVIGNSFGSVTSRVAQVVVDATQFQVASIHPAASAPAPLTELIVTFSRPVDLSTLSAEDVLLTGPDGAVSVTDIVADDAQTVRLQLGGPLPDGNYSVAIGPDVQDIDGSPMLGGVMVPLYRTDFDERVGPEWNLGDTASDASISAGGVPPRFAGFHGNNTLTLTLANLAEHQRIRLVWDLFVIDSWDGNAHDDAFVVSLAGSPSPLWRHNFSQWDFNADSYPGTPTVSGSNFSGNGWNDSVYRNLEVEFDHTSADLSLQFAGANLQGIPDESWGIDNVRLYIPSAADGRFLARFTVDSTGPRVAGSSPVGTITTPVSSIQFAYSEPIDADSVLLEHITLSTPEGVLPLNRLVREASDRYLLEFPPVRANTTYTVRIQPTARDAAGNRQDQDEDGTGGEALQDVYTATFHVLVPPLITGNPSSQTILRNNPATFTVSAQFTEPVTYQWFHDAEPIPDSNRPTLTIPSVTAAHAGAYYCRVTDLGGSSPSSLAALNVLENHGTLLPSAVASRDVLPTVPGNGVSIELFNGIGGGPAPLPTDLIGRSPSGTTLSPVIDFPNPGSVISVGDSFNSFFQQTTTPPEQVLGLAAANFILRHRFHLRVSEDLDLHPETEEIDLDLHVGSDDGFRLTVAGVFLGSAGDRGFSWSTMPVSFGSPGLYEVELLFAANAVGASGLEFAWTIAPTGFAIVPQDALYITPDLGDQLITFEEVPTGTVVLDHYLAKGIRFSTASGTPGTTDRDPGRFVPVSPTRVFGTLPGSPEAPSVVDLNFVSPDSTTPATTPFVSLFIVDAEASGTRVQAFDPVGTEIFSQSLNAGPGTQTPVSITHPQIARVRLTLGAGDDLVAVDNVSFITPVALPDLEVSAVTVPAAITSGTPFHVTWQLRNRGTVPVAGPFQESVAISSSNLGTAASVLATLTFEGTLLPGDTLTRTQSVTLPVETVGTRYFVVTTDAAETILESGAPANNRSISGASEVTLPPRPDLAITGVTSPASATPGQTVTLSWTLTNQGTAPAVGPFVESVGWSNNAANSEDPLPAGFNLAATLPFEGTLQPGESVPRSITFSLAPNATAGTRFPIVITDSSNVVFESVESNNSITGNNVEVDTLLSLVLSTDAIAENGGNATATLTRNRGLASEHPVILLSSDPTEATVPASVVFPAGAATLQFLITPAPDGMHDGDQTVTISANATTAGTTSATIQITDVDQPRLTLAIESSSLTEGLSSPATLTRDPVTATDLIVNLTVTDPAQFLLPLTVTIPAGQASANFAVISAEDTLVEPDTLQTVTASASGFAPASDSLTVVDNDSLTLELSIAPQTFSEAGGATAATGTVTRSPVSSQPVFVALATSDPTAATIPPTVVIPANTASATFPIAAVDDALVDGEQVALISATASLGGRPPSEASPQTIVVTDNDGPALILTLNTSVVAEGVSGAATGTVRRNTTLAVPLVVTLLSSDPSEATVPATIEIPAGSATASFVIDSIADAATDGSQMLTITSMAPGFTEGSAGLTVTDLDLPDLVVASVTAPPSAETEQIASATYRIENRGNTPAVGPFLVRIYLSTDAVPGGDSLAGQFNFTGTLLPGGFFELSPSFTLPRQAGDIYPVVEVDPIRTITELSDANNLGIVATPIVVQSAYTAVASTDITQAPANTVVPIRGSAVRRSSGAPAGNVRVSVHVVVRGLRRTLGALTDSAGNFSLNFNPLPGEAGNYSIAAAHPGDGEPAPQDQFTLIGFKINPVGPMAIIEGESAASSTVIENLSDVPLPGLTVETVSVPPGITVTPTLGANELPGNGQVTLAYGVAVANGITTGGLVRFRISTASGLTEDVELPVIVNALRPVLVATPSSLETGMRRGTQTTVRFDIVNRGGRGTGPLRLLAPPLPWLSIAAGAELADLAPGATNPVTLVLTPPADLPLGPYSGSLFAQGEQGSVTIPFNFRALSDANGDLRVEAVDEFTYYAEGEPRVNGATVVVLDAITGTEVARKTTGPDGIALFQNLREDYYRVEVSAPDHGSYRGTHLVEAGGTADALAFLPRQTVRYRWTVEPIQIEDRTQITIETVFETAVPTPVVTMEPTVIDLSTVVGDETQVDLTLTNHGLVTAQNSRFQLPTHPDWEFIPLITEVGDLPARSSLTVPMTIRRLTAGAGGGRTGAARRTASVAASGPCVVTGGLLWDLLCGPRLNTYTAPVTFNNAGTGCGGGGGGGWIGFGGWGGGFSGGGGPSSGGGPSFIFNPPDISPPELCSCDLLPKVCMEGGINVDLGGQVERLMTAILSKLPAARLTDASMKISLSGELCTCCVDNQLSWEGNATGNATLSAQVEIGPGVAAELPFEAPAPWEDVAVSGRALAGIRLNLNGSVEASYTRECGGGEKFCVNGNALLTAFAGAEFEGNASAGMNLSVGGDSGSVSFAKVAFEGEVHGQIGIEGNLGANFSWCNDSGGEISACGNLVARANIGGSLKGTLPNGSEITQEFGANGDRVLAGGECGSDGDSNLRRLARSTADINGRITEALPADLFPVPRNEIAAALNLDRPPDAVCARVKLKLEQEAVLTRDAFRAALEIENADPATLTEIGIELRFRNEAGDDVAALFGLRPPELSGIGAIDGHGTLAGNTTGRSTWVLIPTRDAAGTTPIVYRIGGTLRYRHNGVLVTVPLADVPITVYPQPLLSLQYFHQRDVYSDDPFTPDIEPSIPYALGIFVRNSGAGEARNFRITSAQPQIVENERGLLIDFQLIGTEVAGESIQPSLTANFGSIAPGDIEVARWLFTSSLQGLFIDYSARFEHIDGLGNPRLSLIDEVSIHEMIRQVEAQGTFDDGKPDFLVNDLPDLNDLPDRLYLSDGSTNNVEVITLASVDSPPSTSDLEVELTSSSVSGWAYLRIPEPSDGSLQLRRVVRSDGIELPLDKLWWTTDRTFVGMGLRPVLENILHVLDHDSTGRYTLHYTEAPPVDASAPSSQIAAMPAQSAADIAVNWTQSDDSSGVAGVDVFVSIDDGPFSLWLSDSRLSGSLYRGTVGRRYAFYSVARDVAGNQEEAPAIADASTFVAFLTRGPTLSSVPNQTVAEDGILDGILITVADPDTPLDLVSVTAESSVGTVIPTAGLTLEGTGSTRTLRAVPSANQHGVVQITLRASDGVESSSQVFTVTVEPRNDTPVARNDAVVARPRQPLRIPLAQLLSNDSDVDGDFLTVSAVAASSEAGGSLRIAGAWVIYTPPTPSPASDRFTYTASDPSGATATATVGITFDGDQGSTLSVVSITPASSGQIVIEFVGIPNRTYAIQRSPSLTAPMWSTLGSVVADRFGRFTFTDTNPPAGEAFYRTVDTTRP